MRHALLGTTWLLFAGCFGPQIASGAFLCEPQDDPPCPSGFHCFDKRCVDNAADAGVTEGAARDLGSDAGALRDLTVVSGDLRQPPSDLTLPADLRPLPDLAPPA